MNEQVRAIKTQRDYDAALSRLSDLMDQNPTQGSNEESELELLAIVIEAYERKKVSPITPDPIEAIRLRMDQQNLTPKDLVPLLGSLSKVSEILSRKRPLSLAMIRALHKGLGIPAEVLIQATDQNDIDLASDPQHDFTKFPLQEMLDRGCFPNFRFNPRDLKAYAEDLIRGLIATIPNQKKSQVWLRAPLHQKASRKMDDYALMAWHICAIKQARSLNISIEYVPGTITQEWLRDLAKLSRFDSYPKLAREYLAAAGIALVFEDHFKKTYLDGAAMLDGDQPVVALTLRHDRIDNFWFALMHELIHVDKHLKNKREFIADNLEDGTRSGKEEEEADEGAREALIPSSYWAQAKVRETHTPSDAMELANQLRIHPAIVAGRVRHETGNWRLLSNLIAPTSGSAHRALENTRT